MQKQFLCVLAIFAIVAAMTFIEADACRRCNQNECSGCAGPSFLSVALPSQSYSSCHSCGGSYNGHSYLPKHYCGDCLRRKVYRLSENCGCGC